MSASTFPAEVRAAEARERTELHHVLTVSVLEAAALLGMSRAVAYKRVREGAFPVKVHNIAGYRRVRLIDIEALLDS